MEKESEYKQQLMQEYKQEIQPLLKYLPWLEQNVGKDVSSIYGKEELGANAMSFPVYDGTLMSFVKEAGKSPLMDRNYRYIYTRNHIENHDEERKIIRASGWREWDILKGILSRYVMEGRIKGFLWNEAVKEQIFYLVLKQMRDIVEPESATQDSE